MCHKTNSSKRTSQCLILTAGIAVELAQATLCCCVILTQGVHAECLEGTVWFLRNIVAQNRYIIASK